MTMDNVVHIVGLVAQFVFWACYFIAGWDSINATFHDYPLLYRLALTPLWMFLYVFALIGEKLHVL